MEDKKYKVAWDGEIISRDMRLDDALIFIEALCKKYDKGRITIGLLDNGAPDSNALLNKGA